MNNNMDKEAIKKMRDEMRKEMFEEIEAKLLTEKKPEDRMFAVHPNEDHIIVSHALFLIMSKPLAAKLTGLKGLYLLRKYEEEMLTAYLTESEDFPVLLNYCNILYDMFPHELVVMSKIDSIASKVRKLQAIAVVAAGYGGDMKDELADDILDDLDFAYNRVCCPVIERMMPKLQKMVETEMMVQKAYL